MSKGEADAEVTRAEGLEGGRTAPQRGAGCRGPREDRNDRLIAKAKSTLIMGHDPAAMGSMLLANPTGA